MTDTLPQEWSFAALGDVLKERKERGVEELPLLAVTGKDGVVPRDGLERRDTSNSDKSKYLVVRKGDIAYNTMRMWQGVSGVSSHEGLVSPAYTVCRVQEGSDSAFLGQLLKLPSLVAKFRSRSQGLVSDTWNLKYQAFSEIRVQVPPLGEQKRIAEILGSVDDVIEHTRTQIAKLQDLKTATMNELLTKGIGHTEFKSSDLGVIPQDWREEVLGDLGKTYGGLTGKSKSDFGSGDPFITYLQVFNDQASEVSLMSSVLVADDENQKQVQFGDIIFSGSSETADEVGMTSVFLNKQMSPYLNSFCFGLRLNDFETLQPQFASYLFRGPSFREAIRPLAQGSTRFNLSKTNLMKLRVSLPPLDEQERIAEILGSVDNQIITQRKTLCEFELLKKSLMQYLLTGKVRVSV